MIRLKPGKKPAKLTPGKEQKLTDKFMTNPKKPRVWDKKYIKNTLLDMSYGKCCYCECKIMEESKYLEVEHFRPKSKYPQEVVKWENLLPSCKRCNGKKGEHDTGVDPIIHPVNDDPQQNLVYRNLQIKARNNSIIGDRTVQVLDLNDPQMLVPVRMDLKDLLETRLKDLNACFHCNTDIDMLPPEWKTDRLDSLKKILSEAIPSSEFSAIAASIILANPDYAAIKDCFLKYGLWNSDLETLETQVRNCAL